MLPRPRSADTATRRCDQHSGPRAPRGRNLESVAGLWTGLLASPSLRVGRQGHGARADTVGQPTAVPPVLTPDLAPDLRRCVSVPAPVRGSCDPSPTVHSLWTPVWNHAVRASTVGAATSVRRS